MSLTNWNEPSIDVSNVMFWEQLYYKPGTVGIYVAWNPYTEFYLIVYNLYSHLDQGIKTFYGKNAHNEVKTLASQMGIILTTTTVRELI
jgi:hypothetical protein